MSNYRVFGDIRFILNKKKLKLNNIIKEYIFLLYRYILQGDGVLTGS